MSETYTDLSFTSFPDEIQTFVTMLNMTIEDASAINGYQTAMRNGDYTLARQYFNQINNGSQKIVDAEKINTLMETCIAIQRFYKSDIEPYLEEKQEDFQAIINTFSYVGQYNSNRSYKKNNFVLSNVNNYSQLFLCIADSPIGTNITNTNYWRPLTIRGEQGASGDSLSFRYTWDSTQTYYSQDVVVYNNIIWVAKSQNTNQPPSESSSYWDFLYTASQDIYPFSSSSPSVTEVGSLWFEIL
jgi:hypothetical protein